MQAGDITGWYGKLPSLGDFASRRLTPHFIEPWDDWLATGMAEWRERDPSTWLDDYLCGPSWRFLLMPGVLPNTPAWAGVLMPSVDKVGRYFPLTLAQPLPELPAGATQARALAGWLQALDDLAVTALQDDWSVEQLEAGLLHLGSWHEDLPQLQPATPPLSIESLDLAAFELGPVADVAAWLSAAARESLVHSLRGKGLWLRSDSLHRPVLRITTGLPRVLEFSALMQARDPAPTTLSQHESPA